MRSNVNSSRIIVSSSQLVEHICDLSTYTYSFSTQTRPCVISLTNHHQKENLARQPNHTLLLAYTVVL